MDFILQGPLYGPLCIVGLKVEAHFNSKWAQLQIGPNIKRPYVVFSNSTHIPNCCRVQKYFFFLERRPNRPTPMNNKKPRRAQTEGKRNPSDATHRQVKGRVQELEELDLVFLGSVIRVCTHGNSSSPCLGKATRLQCWGWPQVRGRLNIQKEYPSEIHPLVVVRCLVVDPSLRGCFLFFWVVADACQNLTSWEPSHEAL
jgi:hypothetical protein